MIDNHHDSNKFNIGDHVIIQSRDFFTASIDRDGSIEIDGEAVLEPMLSFCSAHARILSIDPFGSFSLDVDNKEYGWSAAMLTHDTYRSHD